MHENKYYFEDLEPGMTASFGKTITEADIVNFSGVSGDTNPVHLNEEYAKDTIFKTRVAHGMLSASLISTVVGTSLPGPGSIYVSQTLRFKAPVRIGETVTATATVDKLVEGKNFVEFTTDCWCNGKKVIEGVATIMVPSRG